MRMIDPILMEFEQESATTRKVLVERGALSAGQLAPKNSAEAAVSPNAR